MALSPWPSAGTAGRTAAVAKLKRRVAGLSDSDDETICELGEMVSAMIEGYAPKAPQPAKEESFLRLIGYLAESGNFGAIRSGSAGPLQVTHVTNHAAMFLRCGAATLLTSWRIFRAGVIE